MEHGTCMDCGVTTHRRGRFGPHPKRCPEHALDDLRVRQRARSAQYRNRHPELRERSRDTYAAWYAANREHACEQATQWYRNNTERARDTNARWYRENGNKSRAKTQARRAAKRDVDAERFTPAEIFERDGWICQICLTPVDANLRWPDPWSPSLDHLVPISRKGPHTRENTRLAHLTCNVRRGAAVA